MNKKRDPNAFVTNKVLDSAIDHVLEVMHDLFKEMKTYMDKRFTNLENGQRDMKRQLNDLKVDTPTMKEFNELKGRVDKYHPVY